MRPVIWMRVACLPAVLAAAAATAVASAAEPRTRFAVPGGELRLSQARVQAGLGEQVTFTVKLTLRALDAGTLELTLPRVWLARSQISGLGYAKLPRSGSASSDRARVRRDGQVVRFVFTRARRGDAGRFTITDNGLPARPYRLAYRWREGGRVRARGTAILTVFTAPRDVARTG